MGILYLPKYVEVCCLKLQLLYLTILVALGAVLTWQFVESNSHLREVSAADYVSFTMWVTKPSHQQLIDFEETKSMERICAEPRAYDFQWDTAGVWTYFDHSCLPLCKPGLPMSTRCASHYELYSMGAGMDSVIFYTQLEESFLTSEGQETRRNYFTPFESMLGVELQYRYSVPQPCIRGFYCPSDVKGFQNNTYTYLLMQDETILETIPPTYPDGSARAEVRLSLHQMFTMAGVDVDWLDTVQPDIGRNFAPGTEFPIGALGRIAGFQLEVALSCSNYPVALDQDMPDGADAICYIKVQKQPEWASTTDLHHEQDGEVVHRKYHGVSVKFKPGGTFRVFDHMIVYLNLVSMAVLLQGLPRVVIGFISCCFLGYLSQIYSDALYERFSIRERIASLAVRLMADTCIFKELYDKAEKGISINRVGALIKESCEEQKNALDDTEIKAMTAFCFHAIADNKNIQELNRKNLLGDIITTNEHLTEKHDRVISVNDCSIAASHGMRFESLVALFDQDRKRCSLERVFTPAYLRACRKDLDYRFEFEDATSYAASRRGSDLSSCKGPMPSKMACQDPPDQPDTAGNAQQQEIIEAIEQTIDDMSPMSSRQRSPSPARERSPGSGQRDQAFHLSGGRAHGSL